MKEALDVCCDDIEKRIRKYVFNTIMYERSRINKAEELPLIRRSRLRILTRGKEAQLVPGDLKIFKEQEDAYSMWGKPFHEVFGIVDNHITVRRSLLKTIKGYRKKIRRNQYTSVYSLFTGDRCMIHEQRTFDKNNHPVI